MVIKKIGGLISFSLVATIATYFYQLTLSHVIDVSDYGEFAKWLTDLGYLSILFSLGLDSSMMYFSRLGLSPKDGLSRNIIIGFIALILSFSIIELFNLERIRNYSLVLTIFSLLVIGSFRSFYQIKENYTMFGLLLVYFPLTILFVTIISFFSSINPSLQDFFIIYSLSSFLIMIVLLAMFSVKKRICYPSSIFDMDYISYGFKSALNRSLSLFLYASTTLCLYYISTASNVAVFFVAITLSKLIWVLPDAAGNYFYPKFIKIGELYTDREIKKEMYFVAQLLFLVNIIAVSFFYLFGQFLLSVFYSEAYLDSFWPIVILLIGNQGMIYYKILSRYLAARNEWYKLRYSLLLGIVTNIFMNFILINQYGLIGSAIATAISFWVCGLATAYQVKGAMVNFIDIFSLTKLKSQ